MSLTNDEREKIISELSNCLISYLNNDDIKQLLIEGFKGLTNMEDEELLCYYKNWCKEKYYQFIVEREQK